MTGLPMRESNKRRRGFSLVELLLAIFILSIGVISVAALLPAGIYQQRQAVDDVLGPVVANNAIALLRTRLSPDDFGFDGNFDPRSGDWSWRRPGFIFNQVDEATAGSIVIFRNDYLTPDAQEPDDNRIRHNEARYGTDFGPPILITQQERFFPMVGRDRAPTYMWECMFRRHEGRIQVAIFVYRVIDPGGSGLPYRVAPNASNPTIPPLPIAVDLSAGGRTPWNSFGIDATRPDDIALVAGTEPGSAFDPLDDGDVWQLPGQWILDQHGGVHRVLSGRRLIGDGPVELRRAVNPKLSPFFGGTDFFYNVGSHNAGDPTVTNAFINEGVVSRIWFLPESDASSRRLVPIYVTVQEL